MGAAASAQFGPTLDAEAMKPADGSDLVDYNAARAEAVHLRRFLAALRQQVANDGVTAAFEHRDDQGAWHRYAPEQSVLIAVALGQNPNGAAKLPGGPFEVRFGDFATSRKMATAPDTGMVQVNTASDNTRVVRPQLWACTAFALQGPAGWQVLPTAASRGIAAAIANAPDGGTVVIPNTPTEIRWGHAARTAAHPDVPSTGVIAVNLRDDSSVVVRGDDARPPAIGNAAGTAGQWTVGAANDVSQFGPRRPAVGAGGAAGAAGQWTVGAANDVSQFATNQAAPAIGNAAGDDATQWGAAAGMDAGQWGAGAAGDVGQWGAARDVGQWGAGAAAPRRTSAATRRAGAGAAVDVGQWSAGAAGTVGGVAGDAAGAASPLKPR
ncbi:D-arabinose 1-dehydrogenase [Aureococcus anophagefferens]|nr:D-arabinose 1-dehydrogenase [Aureococcus anophagefferens]